MCRIGTVASGEEDEDTGLTRGYIWHALDFLLRLHSPLGNKARALGPVEKQHL